MQFRFTDVALVAAITLGAAMFGIVTRPIGFLSLFWPANAILLGVMMRAPRLATIPCWIAAAAAFLFADVVTGSELFISIWLMAANMAGIIVGWAIFQFVPEENRRLGNPLSVALLFGTLCGASAAAAVAGCGAAPALLDRDILPGLGFWFASELANYIVILPVVLTAPAMFPALTTRPHRPARAVAVDLLPAAMLVASIVVAHMVGGPGAIVMPVPALLWCAVRYTVFQTAMLTLVLCAWQMIAFLDGVTLIPLGDDFVHATMSVRLGVALLALAPLTVASFTQARNELMSRLDFVASRDHLTGALSRPAFTQRAQAALQRHGAGKAVVMMLDLDHFKGINDRFGHPGGDAALEAFAAAASRALRPTDIFGRFGGEEFAVLLVDIDRREALQIAERLRGAVEQLSVAVGGTVPLTMTVSVGVAIARPGATFEQLVGIADRALYRAKEGGRNRVAVSTVPGTTPVAATPRPPAPSTRTRRAA